MAKYKPVRQRRYEKLRGSGFLASEAHILSRVAEKVPYLQSLVADRKILFRKAISKNYTQVQYKAAVEKMYKLKGWSEYAIIASKRVYKLDASAIYKMLRDYETKYKDDKGNQAFKSPWVKKQKVFQEFSKKFERTYQFQD